MQKGFLLYVRFNRNWTVVHGPYKAMRPATVQQAERLFEAKDHPVVESEFASWCLAVPVADGEKLL